MAKRVRDADLENRAARAKLRARGKPYYKSIGKGLHLGYRKGKTEGRWVARRYIGNQSYKVDTFDGIADDLVEADGHHVLNFWQAQDKAREGGGKIAHIGPYRVRDAFKDYLAQKKGPAATDIERRVNLHVLPALGDFHVEELTAKKIREWHKGLVRAGDAEVERKSQCTANRSLTLLKAGLNWAFRENKVANDTEWRRVQPFKDVERSRDRYLTLAEVQRLLNACRQDFRLLVRAALETGARYGELTRLTVGDFNPDTGMVFVRQSKTGKPRHINLSANGSAFFADIAAGRPVEDPMFHRWWKPTEQARWMNLACKHARIKPPITFHGMRHTWASLSLMGGMPPMVVAKNLGHKDTRMIERHYGHLCDKYAADQVRQFAPDFRPVDSNVTAIR